MTPTDELHQIKQEIQTMKAEIEHLKYQRFTFITWIGNIIEGDKTSPSIYEASLLFDLSKQQLQKVTECVRNYDGNLAKFKNSTAHISNCGDGIFFIVEGIKNSCSGQLLANARQILAEHRLEQRKLK